MAQLPHCFLSVLLLDICPLILAKMFQVYQIARASAGHHPAHPKDLKELVLILSTLTNSSVSTREKQTFSLVTETPRWKIAVTCTKQPALSRNTCNSFTVAVGLLAATLTSFHCIFSVLEFEAVMQLFSSLDDDCFHYILLIIVYLGNSFCILQHSDTVD